MAPGVAPPLAGHRWPVETVEGLLSASQLASRWNVTPRTLRNWRERDGLPCVVLSWRADGQPARVGYPEDRCAAWLEARQRVPS